MTGATATGVDICVYECIADPHVTSGEQNRPLGDGRSGNRRRSFWRPVKRLEWELLLLWLWKEKEGEVYSSSFSESVTL